MLSHEAAYASPGPSRAELLEIGIPLVRRVAFRMARRLPSHLDVDDLIAAGNEGLVKAVHAYDASVHPRFEPYAERRVRGAILDELRSWDPVTRHGRRRMAEVQRAIKKLEAQLGRSPREEEIAAALEMDLESYQKLSMELARGPMLARVGEIEPDAVDSGGSDPAALYGDAELKARLAKAIEELPERARTVLALYYQEECTQAEIGQILGVTESRVCQILGETAARLRAKLEREERVR